MHSSSNVM